MINPNLATSKEVFVVVGSVVLPCALAHYTVEGGRVHVLEIVVDANNFSAVGCNCWGAHYNLVAAAIEEINPGMDSVTVKSARPRKNAQVSRQLSFRHGDTDAVQALVEASRMNFCTW